VDMERMALGTTVLAVADDQTPFLHPVEVAVLTGVPVTSISAIVFCALGIAGVARAARCGRCPAQPEP
jgi:hypothetical protein